jgi:hypothetical protein
MRTTCRQLRKTRNNKLLVGVVFWQRVHQFLSLHIVSDSTVCKASPCNSIGIECLLVVAYTTGTCIRYMMNHILCRIPCNRLLCLLLALRTKRSYFPRFHMLEYTASKTITLIWITIIAGQNFSAGMFCTQ